MNIDRKWSIVPVNFLYYIKGYTLVRIPSLIHSNIPRKFETPLAQRFYIQDKKSCFTFVDNHATYLSPYIVSLLLLVRFICTFEFQNLLSS